MSWGCVLKPVIAQELLTSTPSPKKLKMGGGIIQLDPHSEMHWLKIAKCFLLCIQMYIMQNVSCRINNWILNAITVVPLSHWKRQSLERTPLQNGHKVLSTNTVNVCNSPSPNDTSLIRTELFGRTGVPVRACRRGLLYFFFCYVNCIL